VPISGPAERALFPVVAGEALVVAVDLDGGAQRLERHLELQRHAARRALLHHARGEVEPRAGVAGRRGDVLAEERDAGVAIGARREQLDVDVAEAPVGRASGAVRLVPPGGQARDDRGEVGAQVRGPGGLLGDEERRSHLGPVAEGAEALERAAGRGLAELALDGVAQERDVEGRASIAEVHDRRLGGALSERGDRVGEDPLVDEQEGDHRRDLVVFERRGAQGLGEVGAEVLHDLRVGRADEGDRAAAKDLGRPDLEGLAHQTPRQPRRAAPRPHQSSAEEAPPWASSA
jgi:hypothetical protein